MLPFLRAPFYEFVGAHLFLHFIVKIEDEVLLTANHEIVGAPLLQAGESALGSQHTLEVFYCATQGIICVIILCLLLLGFLLLCGVFRACNRTTVTVPRQPIAEAFDFRIQIQLVNVLEFFRFLSTFTAICSYGNHFRF